MVRFYTKDGCHLCDEARIMLAAVAGERSLVITEVDITSDPDVHERFKYTIPVIEVDGEIKLGGRFSLDDLRWAVAGTDNGPGEGV